MIKQLLSKSYWLVLGVGLAMAAPAAAQAATLSLSPTSGSYAAGATFEVKVMIDTGSARSSGVDVTVKFDPSVLQVVDSGSGTEGTQISAGSLYSQVTVNSADNSTGRITFGGATSGTSTGYSGSGTLATITFQAQKEASATAVSFDYQSGSTTDSNVTDKTTAEDILTGVTDASYTITAASGSSSSGSSSGSGSSSQGGGASGTSGSDGSGGSGTVADTGLDLDGYMVATIVSLLGAAYFLTRRSPKHR